MPRNLTPEELALMRASQAGSNSGWDGYYGMVGDGPLSYGAMVSSGTGMDGYSQNTVEGYMGANPDRLNPGDTYHRYDTQGQYTNDATVKDPKSTLMQGLALVGGLGALGMTGYLGGGSAFGGGGGATAGAGFAGDATAAGYGGLDAASAASMGGGASVNGGAALGGMGGLGGAGGAGAGFAGDATAAGYGGMDAASAATMGGGASVNGGAALKSGLLGSLGDLAKKYGPGLLGALAGGTSGAPGGGGRELDPRVLPYLYGDDKQKGGFAYAKGLLDMPVAGNAFSTFYPKR